LETPTTPARDQRVTRALPYVPALDGIRALAVAGVLLYHGEVARVPGGFVGVDVFFVLSGYLITSLLLAEMGGTGRIDLRRFWARRARRLLPAAFLVIAVCVVVAAVFLPEGAGRTRSDALWSFVYLNNWHEILAAHSYFAAFERPSLLQHLWSLAVEEQFYLLWPLALAACLARLGRRGTVAVTAAGAVASALAMALLMHPGGDPSRVYFGTDTHASGLLIGALLAFAWPMGGFRSAPPPRAVALLDAAAVIGLASVLGAMASFRDYDPQVYRGGLFAVSAGAALLIAAAVHPACRVARSLGVAPLRWVGQRSYGIYLWHWPVMALSRPGLDLAWSRWLLVPLQIALAVGLAAISYRWVEQPVRSGVAARELKAWLDRRAPRGRLAVVTSAALAVAVAAVWIGGRSSPVRQVMLVSQRSAAAATSPGAAQAVAAQRRADRARPIAVGASVMLAAQAALGRHVTVDAAVGRQFADVLARLQSYRSAGRLPSRVVVQIGENGPIFGGDVRALQRVLRGVRRVVLVNVRVPRRWNAEVNDLLAATAKTWRAARVADWYDASAAPGLLYDDGTHPNPRGRRVYARLIERALRDSPAPGAGPP
jgi:peptidoglycan/LPS O-acetylase OafA/YrhL/lysophospholipase L1-like esterase